MLVCVSSEMLGQFSVIIIFRKLSTINFFGVFFGFKLLLCKNRFSELFFMNFKYALSCKHKV